MVCFPAVGKFPSLPLHHVPEVWCCTRVNKKAQTQGRKLEGTRSGSFFHKAVSHKSFFPGAVMTPPTGIYTKGSEPHLSH